GTYTYTAFTNGRLTKRIVDCQTNNNSGDFASGDDPSTNFGITETGDGLRQITTYTYDDQGRVLTTTLHAQAGSGGQRTAAVFYDSLVDGRTATLSFPDSASGTYYGPVGYTVRNHAGGVEVQGMIALSGGSSASGLSSYLADNDADPITAVDVGTLFRMS